MCNSNYDAERTERLRKALDTAKDRLIFQYADSTDGASQVATTNIFILPDDIDKAIAIVKGIRAGSTAEEEAP